MSNRNFLWRLFQMYADNSMGSDSCKEDDENKQAKIIINVTSIVIMEVVHEWNLQSYSTFNLESKDKWITIENPQTTLKILSPSKLIIASSSTVLESFSLYNSVLWLKCFQKKDTLLILHKIQNFTRKFRLKFAAQDKLTSLECCNSAVKVLRQYIDVTDFMNSQKSQQVDCSNLEPPKKVACGEIGQNQLFQTILGLSKFSLPTAYSSCNYPTENLETLVRLTIIDPNFPAFVSEVEKTLDTMIND